MQKRLDGFKAQSTEKISSLRRPFSKRERNDRNFIVPEEKDYIMDIKWKSAEMILINAPGLKKFTNGYGYAFAETSNRRLFVSGGTENEGRLMELVKSDPG